MGNRLLSCVSAVISSSKVARKSSFGVTFCAQANSWISPRLSRFDYIAYALNVLQCYLHFSDTSGFEKDQWGLKTLLSRSSELVLFFLNK